MFFYAALRPSPDRSNLTEFFFEAGYTWRAAVREHSNCRAGRLRAANSGEPSILPSMSKEPKYMHHSLNIHLADKAVADEVSAEADIEIEFKEPLWSGPEIFVEDTVRVFCEPRKKRSDSVSRLAFV